MQEADLTPDTIDGISKNKDMSRVLKGVRSDRESWQSAWTGLTGISGMSSTIAVIRNSSAIVREAAERINGYETVRYSIDTSRATPPKPASIASLSAMAALKKERPGSTRKAAP